LTILGVIIVFLGYLVYSQYFKQSNTVSQTMWLMNTNPAITNATIVSPNSTMFSYSFWMYINSFPTSTPANIFNCSNMSGTLFSVDIPDTTPSLSVSIATGTKDACSPDTTNTQIITNNLGIQRWVFVIVSVNANIVDCYIDGKLVVSFQTNGIPTPSIACTQKSNVWGINFGTNSDIYLSNFTRTATPTDPATALSLYSSKPAAAKASTAYSANLQINQNNQLLTNVKLF
jgi:hypothetical protein